MNTGASNVRRSATSGPALDATAVTPHDTTPLANPAKAIYIGAATGGAGSEGALRITTLKGNVRNFAGLTAGTILPVGATLVHATGTGCASIMALHD